jgi:biotin carboxylase
MLMGLVVLVHGHGSGFIHDRRMPRILLIMPSQTYRAEDFVTAADRLGAEVVVASDHRTALAPAMEDRALVVDLSRPETSADRVVELASRRPLDAIVGVDDQGVELAAHAAVRLGLPHNPPGAVAATRNKAALRAVLKRAGIRQPEWRLVPRNADAGRAAEEIGWPCVVKPLSLSASRGVILANDRSEAVAAAQRARKIADDAQPGEGDAVLVERFVAGDEIAVEGLLRGGDLEIVAIFDKPDPLQGPYFEETIYVTPSIKAPPVLERVSKTTAEATRALGLTEGPVHAELRLDQEGEWLIEIAARSIGGLCSRALRFGPNMTLEDVLLRHALGLPLDDLTPASPASGVMMIPIPAGGVLEGVHGVEEARSVPGIQGVDITIGPGRPVTPLPEGDRYLGFIFAAGETPEEVEAALRSAHSRLKVSIRPHD